MKRRTILILVLFVLLFSSTGYSASILDSLGQMKRIVRQLTGLESTSLLPDTTLRDFCKGSVLWTSVDIGGVEYQYKFVTVVGQAFYAIPDTIVKVLHASYISKNKETFPFRAEYPQVFDGQLNKLSDNAGEYDVPIDYHYWADTLQIMPIPVTAGDTIVLKCFAEHKSISVDTNSINLGAAYVEAAILHACSYACLSVNDYQKAEWYMKEYDKKKQSLVATYTRGIDIMKRDE